MMEEFVKWFEDLRIEDVPSVGGKNASLGEMIRNLKTKGVSVPGGFAVTAYAYKYTIEKEGVDQKIKEILFDLDTSDVKNIAESSTLSFLKVNRIIIGKVFMPHFMYT